MPYDSNMNPVDKIIDVEEKYVLLPINDDNIGIKEQDLDTNITSSDEA